ncbi:MAG TPA: thioredoxin domain-containing protein [Pseudonocardiaceae bacterium]|nr:thioredoxin domain-containing protein [Pseudonocardiaceae bacterium]
MGGAERAERKRKQQAVAVGAVTARPPHGARRSVVAGVAVLVLLALVVGVGLWLQHRSDALPPGIPVAAAGPDYPVTAQGASVVIGKADAPVTIDVYEDFLCPACGQFEQLYGDQLEDAVAAGQARVMYHPVAILDAFSAPPGYSTLAAGAALCAAEAGVFPRFHDSLFAAQPREGGRGWTSAQLQQLGRDLGAGDDFARCVRTDHERQVSAATEAARQYLSKLRPDGRLGTPTVLVNGAVVDIGDPGWLDEALGAAR